MKSNELKMSLQLNKCGLLIASTGSDLISNWSRIFDPGFWFGGLEFALCSVIHSPGPGVQRHQGRRYGNYMHRLKWPVLFACDVHAHSDSAVAHSFKHMQHRHGLMCSKNKHPRVSSLQCSWSMLFNSSIGLLLHARQ